VNGDELGFFAPGDSSTFVKNLLEGLPVSSFKPKPLNLTTFTSSRVDLGAKVAS
jgi:hypothetical protein